MSAPEAITRRRAVAVGGSAGGFDALAAMLNPLPADFPAPILVVLHLHSSDKGAMSEHLDRLLQLKVIEPCDKEPILPGRVYVAPANYHMLVEQEGSIALSVDEKVNWSRPSIDVLMESAARAWGENLVAIVLSGANSDGAAGVKAVSAAGGLTMAQNPVEAEHEAMPQAAIDTGSVELVLTVAEMAERLLALARAGHAGPAPGRPS